MGGIVGMWYDGDKNRAVISVEGYPSRAIDLARDILSPIFGEPWHFTRIVLISPEERTSVRRFMDDDWLVEMDAQARHREV
jgi:hypothetical protein